MKNRPIQLLVFTLTCLWALSASGLSLIGGKKEDPLLEPAAAFATRVNFDAENQLNVEIDIAPGYFVYRSKINVSSDAAEFGPLELPDGVKKQDQFFGEVETYRDLLQYRTALTSAQSTGPVSIQVQSQGCADVGVCYPPYTEEFTINVTDTGNVTSTVAGGTDEVSPSPADKLAGTDLGNPLFPKPANTTQPLQDNIETPPSGNAAPFGLPNKPASNSAPAMSTVSSSADQSSSLSNMLSIGTDDDEVLDPEVAFTFSANPIKDNSVAINWNIADKHYLYKKRFSFELISPAEASMGEPVFEKGLWEEDAFFGKSEVFRNSTTTTLPVTLPAGTTNATLKVGYQGCADIGICYPPLFKEIQLSTATPSAPTNNNAIANVSQKTSTSNEIPQNEQDRLADSLKNNSRWLTIATFFGMGLLLTFTPCVLPMIPILSSIIVGSGDKISTGRAFSLSLVYVLAMALTYTVAGVLVGLSGDNIQATLQHPFVLSAIALLFVILSLSMFGFFEIQMPAFIQNRLSSVSNKQKSGSFGGVATMGFLSALIVGPCVTAPLVGALIYIGQTGDAVLGGAALFALAMGMGLPILVIGTTFGKYLPRAGAWMDITKAIFGVMLLGLAIYMLDRVIPTWATMLLSALLLITVGMFMGAFESLPADARGWRRISKGFGYAAIVYGTLLIIGITTGKGTLLRPMQGLSIAGNQSGEASEHVTFQTVKTVDQLNTALATAKSQNKPVIFDFYADWCISCKEMEAFTFTDSDVARKMKQATLLQADVTANDEQDKELLKAFGIFGPPAIIFYDRQGNERKNARVVGFMSADKFSAVIDQVY